MVRGNAWTFWTRGSLQVSTMLADPLGMEITIYAIGVRGVQGEYIGATGNLRNRTASHRSNLKRGGHPCRRLQQAWNSVPAPEMTVRVLKHFVPTNEAEICENEKSAMQRAGKLLLNDFISSDPFPFLPYFDPDYSTMRSRSMSGAEKRHRRRDAFQARCADYVRENPTPYERYNDEGGGCRRRVAEATTGRQLPTWSKGKHDRQRPLTADDLSIGMFAVQRVGERGLSYAQLDRCFRVCRGVGCHRAKAAAILAALMSLGLIQKIGNYSTAGAGFVGRGNCYRVTTEDFNTEDFSVTNEN